VLSCTLKKARFLRKRGSMDHKFLEDEDKPVSALPELLKSDRLNSLHEAYRKHSTELASIEDRENKFLVLTSAGYVAGATAISTIDLQGHYCIVCFFVVIVFLTVGLGVHVIHENGDLRKAVRDMLVRCELAMGFYRPDVFLESIPLYGNAERCYSSKGKGLFGRSSFGYAIVFVGGVLLIVLMSYNCRYGPLSHPQPARLCVNGPC
jgi:hypothetical protein